jgi:hypothetical protein
LQNPSLLTVDKRHSKAALLHKVEQQQVTWTRELLLFHGTNTVNIESIPHNNFLTVNCGTVNRCEYGNRVYIASID